MDKQRWRTGECRDTRGGTSSPRGAITGRMCGRCGFGSAVFVDGDADDTVVDVAVVVRERATAVGLKGPPRANLWQVRCVDVVGVVCAVV